eukprot:SAG11_NODE_996_length_6253_cov_3.652909_2_plen_498_part_00
MVEALPGPNEYVVWDGLGAHQQEGAQLQVQRGSPAAAAPPPPAPPPTAARVRAERRFAASNDRRSQTLRVNGVVVERFAPSLTSFSLIEQEPGLTTSAVAAEKAQRLADPGFYATGSVGGQTEHELRATLEKVLELPSAAAGLVYANFEELSSGDSEVASALAVLDPLFRAFEREAEGPLGYTGIVSDARVRQSAKASACETQSLSPEPYLQFHVDPPIVGPMFLWSFLRKFGSRPIKLDRCCEDSLARCRTRLPALDRLLLRRRAPGDSAERETQAECGALTLDMLVAVPELRRECEEEGFTYQVNRRVAQTLLENAPTSATGAARTDLKRRAVTGHVGGQINCWYQLSTSAAEVSRSTSSSATGSRGSGQCTATQPSLGFLPRDCTPRVLRTCGRQDPFTETATDDVAAALCDQIEGVGMHFFPGNAPGRALVWDGQRVLHSAIYYHREGSSIAEAQINDARSSLEMRYTTLSLAQIEEYSRGILQGMCAALVSE